MTSEQYEELCRWFIAQKSGLHVDAIRSISIPNPKRPGLPEYKHQIDLYWESGDEIALYLNVANAKWRSSAKVEQGEVMLLQQVRQKTGAHKAFMLTNVGFTSGAIAAARDDGIALHIVEPRLDASRFPQTDRAAMQVALGAMAGESEGAVFAHRVENRGRDFASGRVAGIARSSVGNTSIPSATSTRVVARGTTRAVTSPTNRSAVAPSTRSGGGPGGGNRGGPGGSSRR
jgi:hypothetical protein